MLDEKTLRTVTDVMRTEMSKHHDILEGTITPHERKLVMLGQSQTMRASYAPQSGEIFGILGQMKETFETNLKESQKQEAADSKTYGDLKAAKVEEISAISDSIDEKKQQLAEADSTNAESKEALSDKNGILEADRKFLTDLKQRCSTMDLEWEQRKKTRADEVTAVTEAISILSADAAHDTFSKTFNPAFLQEGQKIDSKKRTEAAAVLQQAASASNDPKLAALAVSVNLDAFTQVKAEIDSMVAALDKAKKDDFQQRDTCVSELNKNEQQTAAEQRNKVDYSAEVEEKKATVEEQKNAIETMTNQVADLKLQMSRADEERAKAKKAFDATLSDQRETQALLQKALAVLKGAYGSKAALNQQAPPPGFKERGANGASGVLGMIEMIIEDAKTMEKEALQAEEEEKAKHDAFLADTTASVDKLQKEIVDEKASLASKEQALAQAEINLRDTNTELENLANSKVALKMGCDSLLANFDARQMAFEQEIDALKQAKAILSGMQA
jgi:chromosome segregation ATPase